MTTLWHGITLLPYPDGMVYGWGDAPDTAALIEQVRAAVAPSMTVADVGGGTGVLGILAATLGATVTIYESDTRLHGYIMANADANGVAERVTLRGRFPDDAPTGAHYDILVCNIGAHDLNLSQYADITLDGHHVVTERDRIAAVREKVLAAIASLPPDALDHLAERLGGSNG